jgi:hypothetical protein
VTKQPRCHGFTEDHWEEVYGHDAEEYISAQGNYKYDAHHRFLNGAMAADWRCCGFIALPLMYRWGTMITIEEKFDECCMCIRRSMEEDDQENEHIHTMLGPAISVNFAHAAGFTYLLDKLAPVLVDAGLTYSAADETVGANAVAFIPPLGAKTKDANINTMESAKWWAKCAHVLTSSNLGVTTAQVLAEMPSVEDAISFGMTFTKISMPNATCGHGFNLFYPLAVVAEKLGDYAKSLEYIDAGLSTDLLKAGTPLPMSRAVFSVLRGRVLASAGRRAEAGGALEAAAAAASGLGMWVTEAQALLELKLCVLDHIGHSEHGSRRLGVALRKLKGPAAKLSQLLKGGLNASELMALPVPDAGYRVEYEAAGEADDEDSSVVALREELHGLRLKELRKRARESGLTDDELDDAVDDSGDPKAALVALLLAKHAAERAAAAPADDEEEKVERLKGLKLSELRRTAAEAGVAHEALEDALDSEEPKAAVVALLLALA